MENFCCHNGAIRPAITISSSPGVYFIRLDKVFKLGRTGNLYNRLNQYFNPKIYVFHKVDINKIATVEIALKKKFSSIFKYTDKQKEHYIIDNIPLAIEIFNNIVNTSVNDTVQDKTLVKDSDVEDDILKNSSENSEIFKISDSLTPFDFYKLFKENCVSNGRLKLKATVDFLEKYDIVFNNMTDFKNYFLKFGICHLNSRNVLCMTDRETKHFIKLVYVPENKEIYEPKIFISSDFNTFAKDFKFKYLDKNNSLRSSKLMKKYLTLQNSDKLIDIPEFENMLLKNKFAIKRFGKLTVDNSTLSRIYKQYTQSFK